ncbi:hypothetical protein DFH08DRAFT_84719 [Mycena albidolilacea]|uniref:Uncharacterized protein n=1 Tax=Mycena albidolilacea TaxID=1033008 RepID=A0AAD7A9V6_9AGAR|nr:hypothetical protein DFH08DRAFT_84719 [Mycena albidolilacea]
MSDFEISHDRFFHPFHEDPHDGDGEDGPPGTWPPKTLAELRMCRLSAQLRQKPRWWEKMRDEDIRKKWIQEVKEQQAELQRWEQLTDNMLSYVMAELEAYAALRDPQTGIEWGPYEKIFLSDTLVPEEVTTALKLAVKPLEDVPDEEKDWHPGSDSRVLDLVHPSICPLEFEQTWGADDDGLIGTFENPDSDDLGVDPMFVSLRFQWLPSDFEVAKDGTVKLKSPYINNIFSKHHAALVPAIERVMECAVLLWERVLSALRDEPVPERVASAEGVSAEDESGISCIWIDGIPSAENTEEELEQAHDYDAWLRRRTIRGPLALPDAPPKYDNALSRNLSASESLLDSTIQVIVKLANIVLTPEKPDYPGGTWHVEGMATESIVATFIYYYEGDNIEPCDLNFRMATRQPEYHEQYDSTCMQILYGINRDDACVQDIGSVETKAGRCIAFPNLYQHRVSPFTLIDKTKPGVRKILVFFLIDPTISIISASNIPPQQLQVVTDILRSQGPSSRLSLLPLELLDYIAGLVPGVKSRAKAEAVREEVMKERSIMIESVNTEFFAREFNMCEH